MRLSNNYQSIELTYLSDFNYQTSNIGLLIVWQVSNSLNLSVKKRNIFTLFCVLFIEFFLVLKSMVQIFKKAHEMLVSILFLAYLLLSMSALMIILFLASDCWYPWCCRPPFCCWHLRCSHRLCGCPSNNLWCLLSSCCCCWCPCRLLLAFLLSDSVGPAAVDNPYVKGVPAILPSLRAFASFTTLANIPAFAGIYTVLAFLLMLSCCCLRSCCFGQSCYCFHPCCCFLLASLLLLDLGCCWRPFSSWWCSVAGLPAIAGIPVVGISAVAYKHAVAGGPAVAFMKRGVWDILIGIYYYETYHHRSFRAVGCYVAAHFTSWSWHEDTYAFSGHVRRPWLFKNLKKIVFL